jgi:hypothetical protein
MSWDNLGEGYLERASLASQFTLIVDFVFNQKQEPRGGSVFGKKMKGRIWLHGIFLPLSSYWTNSIVWQANGWQANEGGVRRGEVLGDEKGGLV